MMEKSEILDRLNHESLPRIEPVVFENGKRICADGVIECAIDVENILWKIFSR